MATKLAQVQQSIEGETPVLIQQEENFSFPTVPTENTTPTQQNVLFRLVKRKQKRLRIDGICDGVTNKKTGKKERIWLIRGTDSIWQSDLVDQLKDKDYVGRNRLSLLFENGICRIPIEEERMLEYARSNKHNVGKNRTGSGKYDYYEYDSQEEQKLRYEKQMTKIKTIQLVSSMQEEPMKKLALFLGVRPNDEEVGMPKSAEGIRTELLIKADTQPDLVNKYMGSKEVEIAYMVRKAIMEAKIDLTGQSGNALWAGGNGFITKIPSGKKAYEYLTELAMTNSNEGRAFKEQLETMST